MVENHVNGTSGTAARRMSRLRSIMLEQLCYVFLLSLCLVLASWNFGLAAPLMIAILSLQGWRTLTTVRRYQERIETSHVAIWEFDCRTKDMWFSDCCREVIELPRSRSTSDWTTFLDRLDAGSKASILQVLETSTSGTQFERTLRLRMNSGEFHWFRFAGGQVTDEFGNMRRVAGSLTNIHEQKVDKERLRTAMDVANAGLWDWNIATGTCYFNDNFSTMLGYRRGEIPQDCNVVKSLCHPDDAGKIDAELKRHWADEIPAYRNEIRLRRKDNNWHWVLQAGRVVDRSESGEPLRMVGVNIDIGEQKEAANRLELAIGAAQAGLWDWNVDRKTFTSNATFHTMFDEDPLFGHIPEAYFFSRVHSEDVPHLEAELEKAFQDDNYEYDVDFRVRTKADRYTWVRSTGRIIERNLDGSPHRMIGQHINITPQKETEAAMRQALEELEANTLLANELAAHAEASTVAKSNFLANMSHEIRTPMTAILGFAEALFESELNEEDRDAVDTIHRNGELLLNIINDILDFSKIEAGKMTVEQIDCTPTELLTDTFKLMQLRAESKGLTLKIDYLSDLPEQVRTDPTRLKQILVNLVGNAIKFTDQGSVTIEASWSNNEFAVDVVDTGIGISSACLEELFQPFSQADESTTRRFGGTGLGLTISKRFAELLGGDITAASQPGEGSRFCVRVSAETPDRVAMIALEELRQIPVGSTLRTNKDQHQDTTDGSGDPDSHSIENSHILLAEDGLDNQRLISHVLGKAGANVTVVENGKLAVDAIRESETGGKTCYDVVLMDMQMPVLDGYDATRQLRDMGCELPIIALTAHAMKRDREKCLQAGCTDYAPKPINRDQLIQMISSYLRASHANA
ncbi:MAG: PAS domain-containing protein [Phycisphaerae bacterium]